jgi:hypothetical protein
MFYNLLKAIVALLLRFINPRKPYGTRLFNALARVTVSVAFEAMAIRRNKDSGSLEVYLKKRAMNDTAYPGEWHAPGSVMRPREGEIDVFTRLSKNEFMAKVTIVSFIDYLNHPQEQRGHFFTPVYLISTEGAKVDETHGWFPIDQLPTPMVGHHEKTLIPMAVKKFTELEK